MILRTLLVLMATIAPLELIAQTPDSAAAPVVTVASVDVRQSWTSDRRPLRLGDILTIVIDEQALASERSSDVARANRGQRATLDANMAPEDLRSIGIGLDANSDNTGRSDRSGSLIAVVSVRVVSVDPNGVASIEGTKLVTIDGRNQELRITGLVRSEDVTQQNTILSSRIANGEIFYKGKKMGPKTGIIGKLLGLLWP
jgi:flagellar L-ring protein precursor FlgH